MFFPPVKVAVFDSKGHRMSEWYPLNDDGSTPWINITESGQDPVYHLEDVDGNPIGQAPVFEDVMHTFSEESVKADCFLDLGEE